MSPRVILAKIEIRFWDAVIPILQNYRPLRSLTSRLYVPVEVLNRVLNKPSLRNLFSRKNLMAGMGCALSGGFLGFWIGFSSQLR